MAHRWAGLTGVTVAYWTAMAVWVSVEQVDGWLLRIALIAGAVIGVATIWQRGVKPAAGGIARFGRAVDAVFELRDRQQADEQWKSKVDQRLDAIEAHIQPDLTIRHQFPGGSSSTPR